MGYATVSGSWYISQTDVDDYRNWARQVHNSLASAGLVQTEDTGQMDPDTIEIPSSTSTPEGYEIWRFDDDDQATHPVYIKVEYGRNTQGSNQYGPSLAFSMGPGSDGSGNLQNATSVSTLRFDNRGGSQSQDGWMGASYFDGEFAWWGAITQTGTWPGNGCVALGRLRGVEGESIAGGLYKAGSLISVNVSVDGGDSWQQPTSLKVPSTSIVNNVCIFGHWRCYSPYAPWSPLITIPSSLSENDEGSVQLLDGTIATYKVPPLSYPTPSGSNGDYSAIRIS